MVEVLSVQKGEEIYFPFFLFSQDLYYIFGLAGLLYFAYIPLSTIAEEYAFLSPLLAILALIILFPSV